MNWTKEELEEILEENDMRELVKGRTGISKKEYKEIIGIYKDIAESSKGG